MDDDDDDDDDIWWRITKARDRYSVVADALPDAVVDGPWYRIEWPLVERIGPIQYAVQSSITRALQRNASH
jgi:hypothetical protein